MSFYELRAAAPSRRLGQFDAPERSAEATLANNRKLVAVDRPAGPYRVLYVSGRPNWEFKFLRRAVADDDEVQLVGLVRIAKREPKFTFLGRQGESTNPLYRGFGDQDKEQTEQYDQPVLIRLGTRDETELRDGFPKTADVLYGYHAVILDDVEAGFFTQDQMLLLQKFVSRRGGGLLMLGGAESFRQGDYRRTPVGRAAAGLPRPSTSAARRPSATGWRSPAKAGCSPGCGSARPKTTERNGLASMPAFETLNGCTASSRGPPCWPNVTDRGGQAHSGPGRAAFRQGPGGRAC